MKNFSKHIKVRNNRKNINSYSNEDRLLLDSAKIASSKAVRSSIALGITFKIIRGHEIMSISPDKSIKVVRKISKSTIDISSLSKGMILERK